MDTIGITIGLGWILIGLVSLGLAIPLMAGRVGPNPFYGVRFAESFQSQEAWFAINRFGGQRLALWSIPMTAVGVVALFLPLQGQSGLALLLGLAPLAFVLIAMFEAWRFARRYGPRT